MRNVTLPIYLTWLSQGDAKHIHKSILIDGALFNGTGKRNQKTPTERLEEFLESIQWPSIFGRFNPKVWNTRYHFCD